MANNPISSMNTEEFDKLVAKHEQTTMKRSCKLCLFYDTESEAYGTCKAPIPEWLVDVLTLAEYKRNNVCTDTSGTACGSFELAALWHKEGE